MLAPFLDSGQLHIEGTVVGNRNAYNIPISIELLAQECIAESLFDELDPCFEIHPGPVYPPTIRRKQSPPPALPVAQTQYVSTSTGGGGGHQYDALLLKSISFDPRSLRETPAKFGLSIKDLENLPSAAQPTQVKTKMLSYQLQGLAWLLNMEHPKLPQGDEVRQFWKQKSGNWFNIATNLYYSPTKIL